MRKVLFVNSYYITGWESLMSAVEFTWLGQKKTIVKRTNASVSFCTSIFGWPEPSVTDTGIFADDRNYKTQWMSFGQNNLRSRFFLASLRFFCLQGFFFYPSSKCPDDYLSK